MIDPLASSIEKVQIEVDPDKVLRDHLRNKVIERCKMYGDFKVQFDPDKLTKESETEYVYEFTLPKVEVRDWDLESELNEAISEKIKFEIDYLNGLDKMNISHGMRPSIKDELRYFRWVIKNTKRGNLNIKLTPPEHRSDRIQQIMNDYDSTIKCYESRIRRLKLQLFISILKNPLNLFRK